MDTQRTGREAQRRPSDEPNVATIAEAASALQRRPSAGLPPSPATDSEQRLQTLETRFARLEQAHEGLQDALYRHEVLQDRNNGKLHSEQRPSRSHMTSAGTLSDAGCDDGLVGYHAQP